MKNQARQITTGVIWKQLLLFFFPIVLGSFFQQMYNTVDTIIVGRFVGTQALASVGAAGPILNLINGFFLGLSSGATVILAQFYGANDRQGVSDAVHTGMALAIAIGLFVMIFGIAAAPGILRLVGTPEECMAGAQLYSRIYFSGAVASVLYNMGAGLLRAMGDSKKPMFFLIIACITNILLDLLLVVGLNLGVVGVGIATVISQVLSAVLVCVSLMRLPGEGHLDWRKLRFQENLLKNILYIGIPGGLQYVMFDMSNLIIQSAINSFGGVTVAAWAAYGKIDVTWMIVSAFGVSVTTFVGQNFGAQKYDRVRKSVWVCMGISASAVIGVSALLTIFREPILTICSTDPEVIATGSKIILNIVMFNVLFMPVEVFGGTMRGVGYSVVPTAATCLCVCVFRMIWVWTVVARWHTLDMLCLAYPITWGMCALVFFLIYLKGDWMRKRIAALGMEPEKR